MTIKTKLISVFLLICLTLGHWQFFKYKEEPFLKKRTITNTFPKQRPFISIHIAGEVQSPGIYEIPIGMPIYKALDYAGGVTQKANLDKINLVSILTKNKRIYVPPLKQTKQHSKNNHTSNFGEKLVHINTASINELMTLPGIGPSLAKKIHKQRQIKRFSSIKDLQSINGLSEKSIQKFQSQIRL